MSRLSPVQYTVVKPSGKDITAWIMQNHMPRSLTSFLLAESSPMFQEHWGLAQKQKGTRLAEAG